MLIRKKVYKSLNNYWAYKNNPCEILIIHQKNFGCLSLIFWTVKFDKNLFNWFEENLASCFIIAYIFFSEIEGSRFNLTWPGSHQLLKTVSSGCHTVLFWSGIFVRHSGGIIIHFKFISSIVTENMSTVLQFYVLSWKKGQLNIYNAWTISIQV